MAYLSRNYTKTGVTGHASLGDGTQEDQKERDNADYL